MDVLVADDSSFMLKVLKNVLSPLDFENVYTASDGGEAVEKYEEHKPDVVLLDVVMDNMDGVTALKKIEAQVGDPMVIMVSAVGQDSTVDEALEAGAEDFINKPFDNDEVRDKIAEMADV